MAFPSAAFYVVGNRCCGPGRVEESGLGWGGWAWPASYRRARAERQHGEAHLPDQPVCKGQVVGARRGSQKLLSWEGGEDTGEHS